MTVYNGTPDNDVLTGTGYDTLNGLGGNDTLIGGGIVNGGDGDDTSYETTATFTGDAGAGTDVIYADYSALPTAANTVLYVGYYLTASNGATAGTMANVEAFHVTSGAADDQLQFSPASTDALVASSWDAGAGFDVATLDFELYTTPVLMTAAAGSYTVKDSTGHSQIILTNVEQVFVTGGSGDDQLAGSGGLDGRDGNDTLISGSDFTSMDGGAGNDKFYVHNSADTVADSSGSDIVYTTVNYTLAPGVAIETMVSQGTALTLTGNETDNQIYSGYGNDTLNGGGGNDTLSGGDGNNTLNGDTGDDTLIGGTGIDTMNGGDGNDKYYVKNSADTITDSSGSDVVYTTVNYTLAAGVAIETMVSQGTALTLTGNELDNQIYSGFGNDILNGGGGNDTLSGGDGNDRLTGGLGQDHLSGNAGADVFVYTSAADSGTTASTWDVIQDFQQGTDKIDLSAIDAIPGGSDNAFNFIGTGAFTHTAGQLRYSTVGGNTLISADMTGSGVATFSILLTGNIALTAGSFVL